MGTFSANNVQLIALCMFLLLLAAHAATPGVQFTTSLQTQACAGLLYESKATDVSLSLNGSRAIFKVPHYPGGPIDEGSALYFQWTDIREYGRTTERCAPTVNDLIYTVDMSQCQCSINAINTIENGVLRTGSEIKIFGCPPPQQNLVATASFGFTNATVIETYSDTMPGSPFDSFNYTSPAGDWKFSMGVTGWNWNTSSAVSSYPQNTYVDAGIQMGFESDKNMSIMMTLDPGVSYSVHSKFGTTDLILNMDLGLILDGRAAIPDVFNSFPDLAFPQGISLIVADMPLTFCEPTPSANTNLTKWDNMYSDPSLQVIFGAYNFDNGASNTQKQKDRTVAIAASVTVVVAILVLAAIVIGVILYRKSVNPFAKMQQRAQIEQQKEAGAPPATQQTPGPGAANDSTAPTDSGWRPASKPVETAELH